MAKFPLKMSDGARVRTLEELRAHFDMDSVLKYYLEGKLQEWLSSRYYDEESEKIKMLDGTSADFAQKLCEVFSVEYKPDNSENISKISKRNMRIEKLKRYTTDEKILNNVDNVAFTQKELDKLMNSGIGEIYLCGDEFKFQSDIFLPWFINTTKNMLNKIKVSKDNKAHQEPTWQAIIGVNMPLVYFLDLQIALVTHDSLFSNVRYDTDNVLEIAKMLEKVDKAQSFKWYSIAAENNSPIGQFDLGICYQFGYGTEKNEQLAFEWYLLSAEQGYSPAQGKLGFLYHHGIEGVVNADDSKALEWFSKAADQNDARALCNLGIFYLNGYGTDKNDSKAIECLTKSYQQGFLNAAKTLLSHYGRYDLVKLSDAIIFLIGGADNLDEIGFLDSGNGQFVLHLINVYDEEKFNIDLLHLYKETVNSGHVRYSHCSQITFYDNITLTSVEIEKLKKVFSPEKINITK